MPDNRLCHEWVGNKCRHCGVVYGSVDGPTEGAVADLASVAVLLASAVQEYPDFDDGVPENAKPFIEIAKRLDSLACAVLAAPSPEAPAVDALTTPIHQWRTKEGDWQDVPKEGFEGIGPSFRRIVYARPGGVAIALECAREYERGYEEGRKAVDAVAWANVREDGVVVGLSQHPEDIARWQNPRALCFAHPSSEPKALTAVARLQSHISDRPYSTGQEIFEVVILDRARAKDGMLLYTNPASEPKTMTLTDEKVDAFAERMVFINKQVGRNIVREIERALLADRGS